MPKIRKAPDAKQRKIKHHNLMQSYGISIHDFDAMYARQNGCCAICNKSEPIRGLVVDHNHTTGKVRELLCAKCNLGLGHFQEDPDLFVAAMHYLAKHTS